MKILPLAALTINIACSSLANSSEYYPHQDHEMGMGQRESAVSMQLYYHDICNQIAERPHANMSQAINDISNLATTPDTREFISGLRDINAEANRAKHEW